MVCARVDGEPCQFTQVGDALHVFNDADYCPMHLPLESAEKEQWDTFARRIPDFFNKGISDFSGVYFPGGTPDTWANYTIPGKLQTRHCTVGGYASFQQAHNADWSNSRFLGETRIHAPNSKFTCRNAQFLGNSEINFGGCLGPVDFVGTRFEAKISFLKVQETKALHFEKCTFSSAPLVLSDSGRIPQVTSFANATFGYSANDEGNYRRIRNYFNENKDREGEGVFYALEKRCHRMRLRGLNQWFPRLISAAYDYTARYGHSYGIAFLWFLSLQFVAGIFYSIFSGRFSIAGHLDGKLVAFTASQVVKPFELFSVKSTTEAAFGGVVPEDRIGLFQALTFIHSIASIVLIALFLLALRWRFRRE